MPLFLSLSVLSCVFLRSVYISCSLLFSVFPFPYFIPSSFVNIHLLMSLLVPLLCHFSSFFPFCSFFPPYFILTVPCPALSDFIHLSKSMKTSQKLIYISSNCMFTLNDFHLQLIWSVLYASLNYNNTIYSWTISCSCNPTVQLAIIILFNLLCFQLSAVKKPAVNSNLCICSVCCAHLCI